MALTVPLDIMSLAMSILCTRAKMRLSPTCWPALISLLRSPNKRVMLVLLALLQGCDASQNANESIKNTAPVLNAFTGSEACGQCHQAEYNLWTGSHHQLAMNQANEQTVLGDFNNVKVTYQNRSAHFFKSKNQFFVITDNAAGQSQTYEVSDTFGVEPLQQYLVTFPRGRKQVLDIAWDSRDKSLGGQTWFFIHSDHGKGMMNEKENSKDNKTKSNPLDHIRASQTTSDPLHWTSSFYNWNSRCASCHTTGFKKNYNALNDSYSSEFSEDKVGCESCHGKGQQHIKWAKGDTEINTPHGGFGYSIKDNGVWDVINDLSQHSHENAEISDLSETTIQGQFSANNPKKQITLNRAPATKIRTGLSANSQIQACAGCHSRRLQLSEHQVGKAFTDNYMPMLIEQPLYHNDGQIKDEVFVWGSFTQSKMFQAGVVCSNCHDAHSLEIKIQGNGLCTQCHSPSVYDNTEHHQHLSSSSGAQCVNCHMPDTTYMNVDKRRDHSFKIPRPSVSEKTASPDACTACHMDKTQQWATTNMTRLFGHDLKPHLYADIFSNSQAPIHKQTNQLIHIANNPVLPDIIRASALTHIGASHSQNSVQALKAALKSDAPIIRLGAVRSLNTLPINLRFDLLQANLDETSLSVRLEMARQLATLDVSVHNKSLETDTIKKINQLFNELISTASYDADTPENQVILANFYTARNQVQKAITHYKAALLLEPYFENALLNLADLYRAIDKDSDALPLLQEATTQHKNSPYAYYALGLLYIRQNNLSDAIDHFQRAIHLDKDNINYTYTYVLTLIKADQKGMAKNTVLNWQKKHGNKDMIEKLNDLL